MEPTVLPYRSGPLPILDLILQQLDTRLQFKEPTPENFWRAFCEARAECMASRRETSRRRAELTAERQKDGEIIPPLECIQCHPKGLQCKPTAYGLPLDENGELAPDLVNDYRLGGQWPGTG